MKKSKYFSTIAILTILLFLPETNIYADIVANRFQTTVELIFIASIIIAVIVLFAWKIISNIKRK
jgi:hypothetical protein